MCIAVLHWKSTLINDEWQLGSTTSSILLHQVNKFIPFEVHPVQELSDHRVESCEVVIGQVRRRNWFNRILFSDQVRFITKGILNRHKCRYWADKNRHWYVEAHTQYPSKENIWAVVDKHSDGPFVIEGNSNSDKYLEDVCQPDCVWTPKYFSTGDKKSFGLLQDGTPIRLRP